MKARGRLGQQVRSGSPFCATLFPPSTRTLSWDRNRGARVECLWFSLLLVSLLLVSLILLVYLFLLVSLLLVKRWHLAFTYFPSRILQSSSLDQRLGVL